MKYFTMKLALNENKIVQLVWGSISFLNSVENRFRDFVYNLLQSTDKE